MQARIVKLNENYFILFLDGSISVCGKREFNLFMKSSKNITDYSGGINRWDTQYKNMEDYPGETISVITDDGSILIKDLTPFRFLFTYNQETEKDISASDYAKKHGKSVEQIKVLCRNNKIKGARKFGRDWLIPENAPYPEDGRKRK